jgi:hypothetical protein
MQERKYPRTSAVRQKPEVGGLYSIISSARASSEIGTVIPKVLVVDSCTASSCSRFTIGQIRGIMGHAPAHPPRT